MSHRAKPRAEWEKLRVKSVQIWAMDWRPRPKKHNWTLVKEKSLKPEQAELRACAQKDYKMDSNYYVLSIPPPFK